jgi:hypothetical protein
MLELGTDHVGGGLEYRTALYHSRIVDQTADGSEVKFQLRLVAQPRAIQRALSLIAAD